MCTTDVYTDVYPDGRRSEYQNPRLCPEARNGRLCSNAAIYNHPPRSVGYPAPTSGYPAAAQAAAYTYPQHLPPTPPLGSPRGHSAEAPRPRNNSSSSERNRRPSGVYINGQRILDLNRKSRSRNERIVIVDSPPTPRTPPKQFSTPYTAPPSPNAGGDAPQFGYNPVRHGASLRPVIVDERPRPPKVEIEVVDSGHRRHHSHSSDSRYTHSSADDEDRRRRRREKERREREERERAEEEERQQRITARIVAQNERIARRPAVPVPAAPLKRSSTGYANVTLSGDEQREQELLDAVRRMEINERVAADRRAREQREHREREEEEEAQRRRLMERMMPRRRATVGPGSRRHRVLYDDGLYRWE